MENNTMTTAVPGRPPKYKTAVVMWVSVYPTITLLIWALWPAIQAFPLPMRTLVLSLVMVPVMTWIVVPWVTARFAPWLSSGPELRAGRQREKVTNVE